MRISLPAPTRSLLSGARHAAPLLLAGATYFVLGSNGLVYRTSGLKLAFWSLPLYGLAALLLASDLMRRFGRGRWAEPIASLLSWLGYAVVAYGMVSGLAPLASEMQRQPGYGAAGEALGPYFGHLARLAPWIFVLVMLAGAYKTAAGWLAKVLIPFKGEGEEAPYSPASLPHALMRSGSMAVAIFLLAHPEGFVMQWTGVDLGYLQLPVYLFALAQVLSAVMSTLGPIPIFPLRGVGIWPWLLHQGHGSRTAVSPPSLGPDASGSGPASPSPVQGEGESTSPRPKRMGAEAGLWRYAAAVALEGASWGYLAFVFFGGMPLFLDGLAGSSRFANLAEELSPYLLHLSQLTPWVIMYILLEALYRVAWAYRNMPMPGRTSQADSSITKGKNHWSSFARLGERLLDDPLATVRAVRQVGIWLAAIFLFLHSNGYIRLLLGLDLSFLSPPLYGFAGFLLLSNLVRAYGPKPLEESGPSAPARSFWGGTPLLAGLLLWSALSLLAYLLLDNLTRVGTALVSTRGFTHAGEVALPYLVVIGKLDIWVAIFLALIGLYRSSAVYWRQAKYVAYHPMARAVMMLLLGGMAWGALASLVPMGPMYGALGAVAFSALAAISLGHLANYTKDQEGKPLIASLSQWAAASPLRNANLGAFVAFYSLVIRPTLYATFIYAPLLEWGAVVLLGLYILRGLQGMIEQYHSGPPQQPIWPAFEKHKQVVSTVPDLAFESVLRAQQSFSALGNRSPILAYLVPVLWDNGVPVEQIARTITPLANHADPVQPTWLWLVGAGAQYIPPLKRLSSRFEAGLTQSRVEALRLVQESVESIGGRTSVLGSSTSNGKRLLITSPAKGQISPSPLYQRDARNPLSHLYQREVSSSPPLEREPSLAPLSPNGVRGISEADPWSWAEDAFIERGDRAGLATVVAVSAIGGWQRSSRPPRVGVSRPLEELFRYRDPQPRWYHLPGQRQRLAEERQGNRHNLAVYLKSLVTMSYQHPGLSNQP